MQKIIRIVLPWACFVLIVWVCYFRGSDYIDWRWLVGAVGISAVCYAMLYVKRHKMLGKIEEHRNQLKQQAEEAIAPELENINGNWLKKDMLKRRMIREYLEKNTDYYADVDGNDAIRKVQDWISSLESSIFLLFLPFEGTEKPPLFPFYRRGQTSLSGVYEAFWLRCVVRVKSKNRPREGLGTLPNGFLGDVLADM